MARGWQGVQRNEGNKIGGLDWFFQCPVELCFYSVGARSQAEAEHIKDTHRCPSGGKMSYGWYNMGASLVEKMWLELDAKLDEMLDQADEALAKERKAYLRGLSFAIQHFMDPYFKTIDEVSAEAGKRRKARQDGTMDEHYTPGLGLVSFQPPPGASEKYGKDEATGGWSADKDRWKKDESKIKRSAAPKAPVKELTPKEEENILFGFTLGMSIEEICKLYNCRPEQVEAVKAKQPQD